MSTNYHTPIVAGSAANAATFNSPIGQLDDAISSVIAGTQAVNQLKLGFGASITPDTTGTYTVTHSMHEVTSVVTAVTKIKTLNGGADGDVLILFSQTGLTNRVNLDLSGNISLMGNRLNNISMPLVSLEGIWAIKLFYYNSEWWLLDLPQSQSMPNSGQYFHPNLWGRHRTDFIARDEVLMRPYNGALVTTGATVTTAGTLAHQANANGIAVRVTGSSSGVTAGLYSNSANFCDVRSNPTFRMSLAFQNITSFRSYFGFSATVSGPGNVTNPAATFFGMRFHPTDGDTRMQLVATDGTTPTVTTTTDWSTVAVGTRIDIEIEVKPIAVNQVRLFCRYSVPSTGVIAEISTDYTIASLTTPLSFVAVIIPSTASAVSYDMHRGIVGIS